MGVKIADKLEQFNNGTYYLVDSSAVEYVDKDGVTKSVKDVLDSTPTDVSTHKTTIYENHIDMGKYILLAKITGANYANNIIKFSCPNYKGANDVGFKYEDDMDIYKFELHFNTGSRKEINSYGVTLKQHGLGLYSYPLNNPKNTEPRIEEAIRLYWDYSKGEIYVFLVDIMTAIPHCVLEYTGSGTLLRENTFVMDDLYNRRDGLNGTWEESRWKSIPYNKLEVPPIYELGGGSAEGITTYTTIEDLGLTAPVTVGEIFNAMPDKTMAIIACEAIEENPQGDPVYVSDVPMGFGILTIKKNALGRFSIEYQNSLQGNVANVKRWIGTLKGLDGTGLIWKELQTNIGVVITADTITKYGTEILKYPVGTWRIDSTNIGKQFTDLPYTETAGIIEIDSIQPNRSPYEHAYGYRNYTFRSALTNIVYTRTLNSGNTVGTMQSDSGWQQIQTEKEEDSYIPNVYDRNANGDMPVVGFDRLANSMCLIQNTTLLNGGDTYDEDYVGGWIYTMVNDILVKDKEMFNKIKVVVSIPGVLRIGIVNDKIFEANPRYSTCLVKWLVADFVAFTGLKEYDINDTILEEGQYIFIECRQGESSWYYNQGNTAVTQGKVTYPASSCTSGLNAADKLDSTTNNVVFKSQSVTSKSAIFTFSDKINIGSKLRTNFLARGYKDSARTDMSDVKSYNQTLYKGGLNIGLYRRTKYSDTRVCKCIENGMNSSWVGNDTVTKIYAPYGQERIVGKSVYAFKLDVKTPGNLTIYHLKGKSLDTVQVIDKYTHYVRAKGLQTIHLPFDIKLNSTDEYVGFGGLHCKSTSDNIVKHSCCWHYLDTSQAKWMTTIDNSSKQFYSIGLSNTVYPEKFTSFETNSNYVNIELICRGEKRSPLEDKYISFTGDSITTFADFCTKKADVPAGNSAGDNAVYYPASGRTVNNVDATWWGILAKDNRMQILRNDAWSGSRVSSTTGSTDTKCLCGTERYKFLTNSSQGTNVTFPFGEPEIIINMIGTNDLSGNVELGEGILRGFSPTEDEYKKLYNAYSLMCQRFASWYNREGGKVIHFIIPRGTGLNTYANSNGDSIQKVALEFEKIAKSWGHYFIPLSYFTGFNMAYYKNLTCPTSNVLRDFRGTSFNGSDGLHPNVMGMEAIADGVHRFLCNIM